VGKKGPPFGDQQASSDAIIAFNTLRKLLAQPDMGTLWSVEVSAPEELRMRKPEPPMSFPSPCQRIEIR